MIARSRRVAILAAVLSLVGASACRRARAGRPTRSTTPSTAHWSPTTPTPWSGAASAGPQAFARVLTGFNYHGPDGQVVGDRDFGTISVVGRAPLVLDYQISDDAVYSDGKPITCDDMVLAWAAQSGRFPGFDAANRAGYGDVADVDCAPGQKKARVSFAQDRGFVDFGQLFAATSMMPSHVIADELGAGDGGVTAALQAGDLPTIDRIAQLWNTTWNLSPGPRSEALPVVGALQAELGQRRRRGRAGRQRQVVGRQARHRQDHRVAARRRRPGPGERGRLRRRRHRGGIVGHAEPARRLRAHRHPVGGHRTADLRAERAAGRPGGAARGRAVHAARRDRPERRGADRQQPARIRPPRTRSPPPRARPRAASSARRQPRRGARRHRRQAADRAHRLPEPERATGRHGRHDRQGLRAGGHHGAGRRVGRRSAHSRCGDNQIDVLLASTGGATGSGSTGSSAMDAYDLFSGNGNNLSGYANEQVDGVIGALAVTADPKELARLLGEGAPVLWGDMPTLPLYRQQRTLLTSTKMTRGEQQSDAMGCRVEHGPLGADDDERRSDDRHRPTSRR